MVCCLWSSESRRSVTRKMVAIALIPENSRPPALHGSVSEHVDKSLPSKIKVDGGRPLLFVRNLRGVQTRPVHSSDFWKKRPASDTLM